MEGYSALKRKITRTQATAWVNRENSRIWESNQSQRTNIVWFYLGEVPRVVKLRDGKKKGQREVWGVGLY